MNINLHYTYIKKQSLWECSRVIYLGHMVILFHFELLMIDPEDLMEENNANCFNNFICIACSNSVLKIVG